MHRKLPQDIQQYFSHISDLTGFLWKKDGAEFPQMILKIPSNVSFLSAKIGHGAIRSDTLENKVIHLTLLLQPARQPIISLDCILNPPQLPHRDALETLLSVEQIEVLAFAPNQSFLGVKYMPWPPQKQQLFASFLPHTSSRSQKLPEQVIKGSSQRSTKYSYHVFSSYQQCQIRLYEQTMDLDLQGIGFSAIEARHQINQLQGSLQLKHFLLQNAYFARLTQDQFQPYLSESHLAEPNVFALPERPLWIEMSSLELDIGGLFFFCPAREWDRFLKDGKQLKQHPLPLIEEAWQLDVVDTQGQTLVCLSLQNRLSHLGFAREHQCATNTCQVISSDIGRPALLREAPPLLACKTCQQKAAFWKDRLLSLLIDIPKIVPVLRFHFYSRFRFAQPPQEEKRLSPPQLRYVHLTPSTPPSKTKTKQEKKQRQKQEKQQQKAQTKTSKPTPTIPSLPIRPSVQKLPHTPSTPIPPPRPAPLPSKPSTFPRGGSQAQTYLVPERMRDLVKDLPLYVGAIYHQLQGSSPPFLVHLPERFSFSSCSIQLLAPVREEYIPEGTLIDFPLLIEHTEPLVAHCLLPIENQRDVTLLEGFTSLSQKITVIAVTSAGVYLGGKTCEWSAEMQSRLKGMMQHEMSQGDAEMLKRCWLRDHAFHGEKPTGDTTPPQPGTLLERIRLREADQMRLTDLEHAALRNLHQCEVSLGALSQLQELLHQTSIAESEPFPPFPSSSLWMEFQAPISSSSGSGTIDVASVWIRKQSLSSEERWLCTLVNAQAELTSHVYCYTPERTKLWGFAQQYRCPDPTCQQTSGCAACRAGLQFWKRVLHLLFSMYRGEYATRLEVQQKVATRVTHEPYGWKISQVEHVVRYIDTATQKILPQTSPIFSRESWLSLLRHQHPELIEAEKVTIRPFIRHLASGKEVEVSPHQRTVYRRKGRKRKTKLIASSYEKRT